MSGAVKAGVRIGLGSAESGRDVQGVCATLKRLEGEKSKKALSTGLTGLKVNHNPQHTLGVLYGKISRALNKLPSNCAYRKHTEAIVNERSAIVKQAASVEEIEQKINCGVVEEIIVQAENELQLARNFSSWKPWEPLVEKPLPNQWTWPPTQ